MPGTPGVDGLGCPRVVLEVGLVVVVDVARGNSGSSLLVSSIMQNENICTF